MIYLHMYIQTYLPTYTSCMHFSNPW